MNKKVNTILFILGATVFNTIVAIISFFILLILYGKFIFHRIPETGYSWAVSLMLLASIAISIFVYRAVLKLFINKIDVEQYFDPLFVKRTLKK